MMQLAPETQLSRHPDAAASRVGDETVILHLVSGNYFGLDPVGTHIWEQLEAPSTLAALSANLHAEFEVDEPRLTADMNAFLRQMLENEIICAG